MTKSPSVASLKKKADAVFSKYIRYRDGEKRSDGRWAECITCGVSKPLSMMQNGHFVSRSCNKLRYNEQNCNAQCVGCNMFKGGEQYIYGKQIDFKYGTGTAEELHDQRHQTKKFTITELEDLITYYKDRIKEYESDSGGLTS